MYDPLGLSIGTMNLVAAANGSSPVVRRAALTLYPHCAPKLGVSTEDSTQAVPGSLMSGFVERIGDCVALISPDGSAHDPDLLTVEALDAMVVAAGAEASSSEIAIAVPAQWKPGTVQALRNALRTHVNFVRSGMAPRLVPDAIAALTAVSSELDVPCDATVGVLDFGASGTSVTLVQTKAELKIIGTTMRYEDFAGNQIDQALLLHAIGELGHDEGDPMATTAVGRLGRLRDQCSEAKERLSVDAVTELAAELSGSGTTRQIARDRFEDLIQDRLTGFIYAFDDMLARNKSSFAELAALVTVGGGAAIPLVAQRLSLHTRLPVLTAAEPATAAARGALLLAARGDRLDLRTRASLNMSLNMMSAAAAATGGSAIDVRPPGDLLVIDHDAMTDRELAWSQTEFPEVLTRFEGDSYNDDGPCFSMRLNVMDPPREPSWRRVRFSQILIGLCAAVALTAIGGVAITLTAVEGRHTHHQSPVAPVAPLPTPPSAKPSANPPSEVPVTPIAPSPVPPPSEAPPPSAAAPTSVAAPPPPAPEPPPPPPPSPSPSPTMTTTRPAPAPTTTRPPSASTTTPPSSAPPTTTESPSAAEAPPTSESPTVKMTTQWLHVPLIPVPIPIQVPQNPAPQNQLPQNPIPQDTGPQNPFQSPGGY